MSGKSENVDENDDASKYHFVLVHGFGSGAWSWYKVRTLLEASGFKVTCLDLKASGVDPSSLHSVRSFDDYTHPLIHFFANFSPISHQKVILVGHSAGGLSITDATYKYSNKIDMVVYVAATMLKHGFSTKQDIIDGFPESIKSGSIQELDDQISATIITQKLSKTLIYDPPEEMVLRSMLARPGPLKAILGAKFKGETHEVDCVPRVYIRTLQDEVLKPKQQEAMISRWPPTRVFALDTDHNPIFSSPFLLSALLTKAAIGISIY